MLWMGLTGSIGSGKSTVSEILRTKNWPVIDADHLAKEVVQADSTGEAKVLKAFGPIVADAQGRLDRKKMASVVFSDSEKLSLLESIVHPLVQEKTKQGRADLERAGYALAFYDVPLLFEKKLEAQFDGLVVVFADLETCIRRVMARSAWTREEATSRIRTQLSVEEKIKKSHWVVRNNGTRQELVVEVDKLIHDIGRKFPRI